MISVNDLQSAVNGGNGEAVADARRERIAFWAARLNGLASKAAAAAGIIEAETRALAYSHEDGWLLEDAERLEHVSGALLKALSDGGAE
jgi:hypothetical protein